MDAWADVGAHAASPEELASTIAQQLSRPKEYQDSRLRCTRELIGQSDGHAAERVVDRLLA